MVTPEPLTSIGEIGELDDPTIQVRGRGNREFVVCQNPQINGLGHFSGSLIRLTAVTRDVDPSLVLVDDVLGHTFYLSYSAVQP